MTNSVLMRVDNTVGNEDLDWAIGLNRAYFNFLGVWPEVSNRSRLSKYLHVPLELLLLTVGVLVPELWALTKVTNHLPLVLDNLVPTAGIIASTIKLFLLWRSKHMELAKVVTTITFDWRREKLEWERNIMLKMAQKGRFITVYGLLFVLFSLSGVFLGPTVGFSFRTVNNITDHMDRFLPLQAVYPFDVSKTPYFELSFLTQLFGGIIMGILFMGPIAFFAVLVQHICGQLEILKLKLKNLQGPSQKVVAYGERKTVFSATIAEIVETHVQIIRTIDAIEKIYKVLVLVQLTTLSAIMCSLGFQVVNVLNEDNRLTFRRLFTPFGNGLGAIMYSYIYCTSGEVLIKYSEDFFHGLFEINWFELSPRNSKDLLPLMQRSQYPLHLTAAKIMVLNMATFCQIIKTSAGYLSVLLAVREK